MTFSIIIAIVFGFLLGVFPASVVAGVLLAKKDYNKYEEGYSKGYDDGWEDGYKLGIEHKFDRRIK
jgi:hypothetical protein